MGFFKRIMDESREQEKMVIQAQITADTIAEEQRRRNTCKLCKAIFSEGVPYQYTMFGNPKSYICKDCAKRIGHISTSSNDSKPKKAKVTNLSKGIYYVDGKGNISQILDKPFKSKTK
jgi:protein-arginine kinase activator protein McsA